MIKDFWYHFKKHEFEKSCINDICPLNYTLPCLFTVKADGAKTDCASTNGNCPAHATCATTVCNCDAGWVHDGSGLCKGMNKTGDF